MLATVTPVFEADPRWVVLAIFTVAVASGLYGLWLLVVDVFETLCDWWYWRWRKR